MLLWSLFLASAAGQSWLGTALACNGLREPEILSTCFPVPGEFVLTWIPLAPSARNATPIAFEVGIADEFTAFALSHQPAAGLIWSSGRIVSSSSFLVLPRNLTSQFEALSSYKWHVRIWNSSSTTPMWSEEAWFDIAPSDTDWKPAVWVGGGSQLRADWVLPATPVIRARAFVSGVGAFDFHVNGHKIGDHLMDPGQSAFDQKVLFRSFNITRDLISGQSNSIGGLLGNSIWGYLDIFANRTLLNDQSGDSTRALLALLVVTLVDGSRFTLVTSPGVWAYRHGPIVYDHMWHGEIYDSQLETAGHAWDAAPLSKYPAGTWQSARAMSPEVGRLFPAMMPAIRVTESLDPISVSAKSTVCDAPLLGGTALEGATISLGCAGGVIQEILFASFGTPQHAYNADCSTFALGNCDSNQTLSVVKRMCLNQVSCEVLASNALFGEPCAGVLKTLVIAAKGSASCVPLPAAANRSVAFDFGENMAGFSSIEFKAPALGSSPPTTIMIRVEHTEIEDASGLPINHYFPGMEFGHASKTCSMSDWYERKWYECANQTDGFIFQLLPTPQTFSYTPTFTYHGFRFVLLTATEVLADGSERPLSGALAAAFPFGATIQARKAHSDLRKLSSLQMQRVFPTEPLILEQIFNATIAAHLSNLWSIPTDCPQREKRGWMGDAGISSHSLNTFFDAYAFHANYLRIIVDNQQKLCTTQPSTSIYGPCTHKTPQGDDAKTFFNGSVPDVTPFSTGPYGGNPGTTDWQAAFVAIARALNVHYGAVAAPVLAEIWPSLSLFMTYLERLVDPTSGLLLQGARGDWVPPDGTTQTPTPEVAAFFHTLCVGYMSEIATTLNLSAEAARYASRLESNRVAYYNKFYNASAGSCCFGLGSQTSNIMALYIGAVPSSVQNATVSALVRDIQRADGPHLWMGIFGTTWVFEVLQQYGYGSLGLEILETTTYPSLGYMIVNNATTLWESWDGTVNKIGGGGGASRNHIMFGGGVARFIAEAIGGLGVPSGLLEGQRGASRVRCRIAPAALRKFSRASSSRMMLQGLATVSWKKLDAKSVWSPADFELNLTLPSTVSADVYVPLGQASYVQVYSLSSNIVCTLGCRDTLPTCTDFVKSVDCQSYPNTDVVMRVDVFSGTLMFRW